MHSGIYDMEDCIMRGNNFDFGELALNDKESKQFVANYEGAAVECMPVHGGMSCDRMSYGGAV